MKSYLKWICVLSLYWLLWFTVGRLVFITTELIFDYRLSSSDFFKSLWFGLYMDASSTAYLMLVPVLICFISRFIHFTQWVKGYTLITTSICSILYSADAMLYHEWGYRLDYTAFRYLNNIQEATHFVSTTNIAGSCLLFGMLMVVGHLLYRWLIPLHPIEQNKKVILINFLVFPLLIIPIRGGLDIIPMNPGKVYFSNHPFANHSALNVPWNLLYSLTNMGDSKNKLQLMSDDASETLMKKMVSSNDTFQMGLLKTKKPKIIFFLLESFTAQLINHFHEGKEITPGLNKLFKTGIYFSEAYASGDRTEMGIASALSGFPAQPYSSILNHPDKSQKLPSLLKVLRQHHYHTAFYYGGDASFANMNSYFLSAGCDVLVDKHDFPASSYNAKWGVHDHLLFERFYADLIRDTGQYFKVCLSLSSHPPYEIPETPHWEGTNEENLFVSSAHYTDKFLSQMIEKLSLLPNWNEMLVVAVADHGARMPGNSDYHTPQKYKIPIWFGGGAIAMDTTIRTVVSQSDIPKMLLDMMNLPSDSFKFSKNVFKRNVLPFAYYSFNNGYGIVDSCGSRSYTLNPYTKLLELGQPCMPEEYGKAYLQTVLKDFQNIRISSLNK